MASDRVFSDPDLVTGRLFFAVGVPGASRAPLEDALPELGRALPHARVAASGGWHLTLAFLGQVRPEHSADVLWVGERAVEGVGQAQLRLRGAGAFPSLRRGRVLWAGVEGDVDVLVELAAKLADGCKQRGLRFEERPLHPHLTLARFPIPEPVPEAAVELVTSALADSPGWQARELACYRSTLTNRGARYQAVWAFPLTG